jgi:hypothetical protein
LSLKIFFIGNFLYLQKRLRKLADGKTSIKMFHEFNHATLDAIAQVKDPISQSFKIG